MMPNKIPLTLARLAVLALSDQSGGRNGRGPTAATAFRRTSAQGHRRGSQSRARTDVCARFAAKPPRQRERPPSRNTTAFLTPLAFGRRNTRRRTTAPAVLEIKLPL